MHNYYLATEISEKCTSDSPDDTIKVYGVPNSIEDEVLGGTGFTRFCYNYDGFSINFLTKDGAKYTHEGFTIYSPKIKIRYDIHVGSTRQQIMNAYSECQEYTSHHLVSLFFCQQIEFYRKKRIWVQIQGVPSRYKVHIIELN